MKSSNDLKGWRPTHCVVIQVNKHLEPCVVPYMRFDDYFWTLEEWLKAVKGGEPTNLFGIIGRSPKIKVYKLLEIKKAPKRKLKV